MDAGLDTNKWNMVVAAATGFSPICVGTAEPEK